MDKDTIQSLAVNGATIGISLTDVEAGIRITALIVGLVFTLYKFYLTYKSEKSSINKTRQK